MTDTAPPAVASGNLAAVSTNGIQHSTGRLWRCPHLNCVKAYDNASSYYAHPQRSETHNQTRAPHLCPVPGCTKTYTTKPGLDYHLNNSLSHPSELENPSQPASLIEKFACTAPRCGKIYDSIYRLREHVKQRHENPTSRECTFPGCMKAFLSRASLRQHVKNSHEAPSRFLCTVQGCIRSREGEGFSRKRVRDEHVRTQHPGGVY